MTSTPSSSTKSAPSSAIRDEYRSGIDIIRHARSVGMMTCLTHVTSLSLLSRDILSLIIGYARTQAIIVVGGVTPNTRIHQLKPSDQVYILSMDGPIDGTPWRWHPLPPLPKPSGMGWASLGGNHIVTNAEPSYHYHLFQLPSLPSLANNNSNDEYDGIDDNDDHNTDIYKWHTMDSSLHSGTISVSLHGRVHLIGATYRPNSHMIWNGWQWSAAPKTLNPRARSSCTAWPARHSIIATGGYQIPPETAAEIFELSAKDIPSTVTTIDTHGHDSRNGDGANDGSRIDTGNAVSGWRSLPSLQQPRHYHMSCQVQNRIIVFGGVTPKGFSIDTMEQWIWNDDQWRSLPPASLPPSSTTRTEIESSSPIGSNVADLHVGITNNLFNAACVVIRFDTNNIPSPPSDADNDVIVVMIGGQTTPNITNAGVWAWHTRLNPEAPVWSSLPSLPITLTKMGAIVL